MHGSPIPCVHLQDGRNTIKVQANEACPWCRIEELETRLRKAEAIIADAHASWEATGQPYFREQLLRMATYKPFLVDKLD